METYGTEGLADRINRAINSEDRWKGCGSIGFANLRCDSDQHKLLNDFGVDMTMAQRGWLTKRSDKRHLTL